MSVFARDGPQKSKRKGKIFDFHTNWRSSQLRIAFKTNTKKSINFHPKTTNLTAKPNP